MAGRYAGARVTVMGLGTRGGGAGVARWLAEQGAIVTVTDLRPEADLAPVLGELDGLPVRYVLGRHDERDFTAAGADMVVRNPGVPRRAPLLGLARRDGVPVEMEMSLFFRACPAPIVGVTGTKGKTTTATLTAALLREHDPRTVLAGNMGVSALSSLAAITPDTPVVIELSSWQVESLIEHRLSPRVAILTNISEDHLNTYDGFDDYADTKRGLLAAQGPDDVAILNVDDPEVRRAAGTGAGRVLPFGVGTGRGDGAWLEGDELLVRDGERVSRFARPAGLALGGEHGARNALAAIAAAGWFGAAEEAIQRGLDRFAGVPDRMEPVATVGGVAFINDTTATAPAAAVAAFSALSGRRVLWIGGGSDKGADLSELAESVARSAAGVYLLAGTGTDRLAPLIRTAGGEPGEPFGSMAEAVGTAFAAARPGDVVLLSPGCASFGLFQDEFDRGRRFREAVSELAGRHASPTHRD